MSTMTAEEGIGEVQFDTVLNGRGYGELGEELDGLDYEAGMYRPYFNEKGVRCVSKHIGFTANAEGKRVKIYKEVPIGNLLVQGIMSPVMNATSLRKDEWIAMDRSVSTVARKRLRAYRDVARANSLSLDGMSRTILEHEMMSDPGRAQVDMDGLSEGTNDAPLFTLQGIPLPITHCDFHFPKRKLMISRRGGTPLDMAMAEAASERVAESIEKTTIGIQTGLAYGKSTDYVQTSQIYGFTNFPQRATKTDMSSPTGSNGPTILSNWLALRDLLYGNHFYGPYVAYVSSDYDEYLDNLFSTSEPSAGTLRKRLLEIDNITDIRRLDYLTDTFTVVLVQMDSRVVRAINGMDFTTIQWESKGGMQINFKVMAIQVPQLRFDYNSQTGIAVGTTS
jgi:hypothetical protein